MNALVHGMSIREYHAMPDLSATGLIDFAQSPYHYFSKHVDPRRPEHEEVQAQLEGNLAHCAILEPQEFANRYPVGPDVRRNTKEWKAFVAEHPHALGVIKQDQWSIAWSQARSVRNNSQLGQLLSSGEAEVSAFWTDPDTGVKCRCRPDWVHYLPEQAGRRRRAIIVDVKTCGDASQAGFTRQVTRMRYHWQAAHYTKGFAIAADVDVLGFVFAAVEMQWPQASAPRQIDDESMARADSKVDALMASFAECQRINIWPGYSEVITPISLPDWA